jgi:hypothetical protein
MVSFWMFGRKEDQGTQKIKKIKKIKKQTSLPLKCLRHTVSERQRKLEEAEYKETRREQPREPRGSLFCFISFLFLFFYRLSVVPSVVFILTEDAPAINNPNREEAENKETRGKARDMTMERGRHEGRHIFAAAMLFVFRVCQFRFSSCLSLFLSAALR